MLQSKSESPFARARRIYGKPALLSGSLAYGLCLFVQLDQFHGSVARTALNIVASIVPCALAGCLLALALVPLSSSLSARAPGARDRAVKALKASAVLGIAGALAVVIDHLGRMG